MINGSESLGLDIGSTTLARIQCIKRIFNVGKQGVNRFTRRKSRVEVVNYYS